MKNVFKIAKKEYLQRVKRKLFIILTLLTPLLMMGIFLFPAWIAQKQDTKRYKIYLVDSSGIFKQTYVELKGFDAEYLNTFADTLKTEIINKNKDAIIIVPKTFPDKGIKILALQPVPESKAQVLKLFFDKYAKNILIKRHNLPDSLVFALQQPVRIKTEFLGGGSAEEKAMRTGLGIIAGIALYFFIFMYAVQIMHSVKEEKQSRIAEILISSVKPVELLTGKIIGITLVALTQLFIWILFGVIFFAFHIEFFAGNQHIVCRIEEYLSTLRSINIFFYLGLYLLYFILGYLLYSLLFAAIAAAVDNDSDMQQFMMPVTIPLIFSIVLLQNWIEAPTSQLAFWFSVIPFTSPITMVVLASQGVPEIVPVWQLLLSIALLLLTVAVVAWAAGKIYRTGLLMYGKKISYKEIWKMLKTKA